MTIEDYSNIVRSFQNLIKQNILEDEDFDNASQKEILERDKQYTSLLKHYVTTTEKRNESKETYKWCYFKIIIGLLILLNTSIFATIIVVLIKCTGEQLVSFVPVFIASFTAFASSVIAIPLAITKYLFSKEEDKFMTDIISHTQEHDLSGKKLLKAFVDKVGSEQKEANNIIVNNKDATA